MIRAAKEATDRGAAKSCSILTFSVSATASTGFDLVLVHTLGPVHFEAMKFAGKKITAYRFDLYVVQKKNHTKC